jgi:hypothetical protein
LISAEGDSNMTKLLGFPQTVDENAARIVAGGVALTALAASMSLLGYLTWVLALGFVLRVISGPRLSPLGRLAAAAAPRIAKPRLVSGSPKRFAQGLGALLTLTAATLGQVGFATVETTLLLMLCGLASLECLFGFCLGCAIFARLQAFGWIRSDACPTCSVSPEGARCIPNA